MNTKAKWIYYPGDFEVLLLGNMSARRIERDIVISPFWRVDNYYPNVRFTKTFELKESEIFHIEADGIYNIFIDSMGYLYGDLSKFELPAGKHKVDILVYNNRGIPCIKLYGENFQSDESWQVTCNDHVFKEVGVYKSQTLESPNNYKLNTESKNYATKKALNGGILYDFGIELMAYPVISGKKGEIVYLHYGESEEEALDIKHCEVFDKIILEENEHTCKFTRAFRYIFCTGSFEDISALYEYNDITLKGSFKCDDGLLNKIWETSVYTHQLTARELYIDGIKRDRWVWSGDASQSYLMNYYTFYEKEIIERTMLSLLPKPPVNTFANHIMDYTFYWIISLKDYLLYMKDYAFAEKIFDRVEELINFCFSRVKKDGLIYGQKDDWIFIDWAPMGKDGALCAEQMLFLAALKAFIQIAGLTKRRIDKKILLAIKRLERKIPKVYWDKKRSAFRHSNTDRHDSPISRYANIFAIIYDLVNDKTKKLIAEKVLLNEQIQIITTPYMKFYEMQALCITNHHKEVINHIKTFWGGMLSLGATSFWETYDETLPVPSQYEMYGRKYGKSLCHSWGASPLYLLGKFFIGYYPEIEGAKLCPYEFGNFEGSIPIKEGKIQVKFADKLDIYSDCDFEFITDNIFSYQAGSTRFLTKGHYVFEKRRS